MRSRIRFAGLALEVALDPGCSTHPVAFSRAEWGTLTPGQRAHVRTQDALQTRRDFQPLLPSFGGSKDRVEKITVSSAESGTRLCAGG